VTFPDNGAKVDDADEPTIRLLTGTILQVSMVVSNGTSRPRRDAGATLLSVTLDTGGGGSVTRTDALPKGTEIRPLEYLPRLAAAQHGPLKLSGVASVRFEIPSTDGTPFFFLLWTYSLPTSWSYQLF
jgi:hypothetical protein